MPTAAAEHASAAGARSAAGAVVASTASALLQMESGASPLQQQYNAEQVSQRAQGQLGSSGATVVSSSCPPCSASLTDAGAGDSRCLPVAGRSGSF